MTDKKLKQLFKNYKYAKLKNYEKACKELNAYLKEKNKKIEHKFLELN